MDITQDQYDKANADFIKNNKDYNDWINQWSQIRRELDVINKELNSSLDGEISKQLLIEFLGVSKELIDGKDVVNSKLIPLTLKTVRFLND